MPTFDRRQYLLLLKLLQDLGDRREVTSQFGLDRGALGRSAIFFAIIGVFIGLVAVSGRSAHAFLMVAIGTTVLLLVPMLASNAADAFMNPAEASVLAHQPIRSSTYLAAKATFLANAAVHLVVPLNLVPAFAGLALRDTRAFYPVTHMLAAIAAGFFTVLVMCGLFGLLFRIVPLTKLRNAAMWMQLLVGVGVFVGPRLLRVLPIRPDLAAPYWSAVPVTWFASLGLAGQPGRHALVWSWAMPAMLASAVLVVFGVRALTQDYMTRVVLLLRARKARPGRRRVGWMGSVVRAVSGGPSGRAAFAFLARMAPRDWQFRRVFLRSAVSTLLIPLVSFRWGGILVPPIGGTQFSPIHFFPHVLGLLMLSVCGFMVYSDQYQAAWVFLMAPMAGIRAFVRGIYAAIWITFVAVPHAIVLLLGTIWWGAGESLTFVLYSVTLTSLYLSVMLLAINGLPFGSPPRTGRAEAALPFAIVFYLVVAILVAVQHFLLFPSSLRVFAAALVCGVLAALMARVSLNAVEANVLRNLSVIAAGPSRMFKGTDED